MNKYIQKKSFIKKNEILSKNSSLSPFNYREVNCTNKNIVKLEKLIVKKKKGFEPGSDNYVKYGENYFIRITDLSTTNYTFSENKTTLKLSNKSIKGKQSILTNGDICFQTASDVGNVCIYCGNKAYYNSHIIKLNFEENIKYYIFSILKSKFTRAQVDVSGSIKGVDNFNEDLLLNIKIPFPNKNDKQIVEYVSLITQNIIHKEECIRKKNIKIDSQISQEIEENQSDNNFIYKYPTRTEFISVGRMDAAIFDKEVKKLQFKIKNYKNGYYHMDELFNYSRGQNLQVSQIGESIYSDEEKPNFYRMFTNVEMQDDRTISGFRWLGNKNKLRTLPDNAIMLAADGMIVGRSFFYDKMENTITNLHPWIITPKEESMPIYERAFVSVYLSYLKNIGYLNKIKDKSNGGGLKKNHLDKWILIPKFEVEKKISISKEYYNNIKVNDNLNSGNYLNKEKERNEKLGIYQLNMELLDLKSKLDKIINDIIFNKEIIVEYNL